MADKIKGKIEAITDKTRGVKLDGERWFNWTDRTEKFVKKFKIGDEVEIEADEKKNITFIKAANGKELNTSPKVEMVHSGVQQIKPFLFKDVEQLANAVNMFCKEQKVFAIQTDMVSTGSEGQYTLWHRAIVFYWQ